LEYGLSASGEEGTEPRSPNLNTEQPGTKGIAHDEIEESGGCVQSSDDIAAVIEKAADRATDFESFRGSFKGWYGTGRLTRSPSVSLSLHSRPAPWETWSLPRGNNTMKNTFCAGYFKIDKPATALRG
jgi:hypothetical protein